MDHEFQSDVKDIIDDAGRQASKAGCPEYTTLNLGYSLLRNPCGLLRRTICSLAGKSAGDAALLSFKTCATGAGVCKPDRDPVPPSETVQAVFQRIKSQAGYKSPTTMHALLLGILEDQDFAQVLEASVPVQSLKLKLETLLCPVAYTYGIDFLAESGLVSPLALRDQLIDEIMLLLSSSIKKKQVMLIGEAEVGKTAVVQELAHRIIRRQVPDELLDMSLVQYSRHAFSHNKDVTYTKMLQMFLSGLETATKTVLVIDDLDAILSSQDKKVFLHELKLTLSRRNIRCVVVATLQMFKTIEKDIGMYFQTVEVPEIGELDTLTILRSQKLEFEAHHLVKILDGALEAAVKLSVKYFKGKYLPGKAIKLVDAACGKVGLRLSNPPDRIQSLKRKQTELHYENFSLSREKSETCHSRLNETEAELKALQKEQETLSKKYGVSEKMKGSLCRLLEQRRKLIIDINQSGEDASLQHLYDLDEVLNNLKEEAQGILLVTVGPDDIADMVSQLSGLHIARLKGDELKKLRGLAECLKTRVIGQDQAIDKIASVVVRAKIGLGSTKRPHGSFLLLGPHGVGKSEIAKSLGLELFGDENSITRIDLSEFKEKVSVNKLIGAAPGYAGYHKGGKLTNAVKDRPYSVILLDEAEKAHPGVFDLFLQVLSDGRLTDNLGCTVDFTSTIIIFTSNIGADIIWKSTEAAELKVLQQVEKYFKAEFLNRLDGVVIFHPLTKVHIRKIVGLRTQSVIDRVRSKGVDLQFTEEALDFIASKVHAEAMGALHLDQFMTKHVVDRLIEFDKKFSAISSVYISVEGGNLKLATKRKREDEVEGVGKKQKQTL